MNDTIHRPTFGPMVETCRKYGIGRTLAYELANEGLIETFHLKSKRMVVISSLDSLPERLRDKEVGDE